jgi:hypothetical protein
VLDRQIRIFDCHRETHIAINLCSRAVDCSYQQAVFKTILEETTNSYLTQTGRLHRGNPRNHPSPLSLLKTKTLCLPFHTNVVQDSRLLGCYAAYIVTWLPAMDKGS